MIVYHQHLGQTVAGRTSLTKKKKTKKLRNEAIAHLSELRIKIIIILVARVIQY